MNCPACGALAVSGVRACAACGAAFLAAPAIVAPRVGAVAAEGWPSWEDGAGVPALVATVTQVLGSPGRSFGALRRGGGLARPFAFALCGALVAVPASVVWTAAFLAAVGALEGLGDPARWVLDLVSAGVAFVVSLWLGAAVRHGLLRAMGAARWPFEVTFRAGCYVRGATAWLMLVPGLGLVLVPAANALLDVLSLRRAHEVGLGAAFVAGGVPGLLVLLFAASGLLLGALSASSGGVWW